MWISSEVFSNNSSANVKLWKTQLHKIGKSRRFLNRLLGPLLKTVLPFVENVPKSLAKSVLMLLGFTAVASGTDAAMQKKSFGSSMAKLIIWSRWYYDKNN